MAEPDSAPAAGQPEVSVIIPCLNEEPSVGAVAHGARVVREPRRGYGRAYLAGRGFGPLGRVYETALAVTILGLGVQIVFSSFFLGLLTLRAADSPTRRGAPQAEAVDASASSDRPTVMPGSRT